MADQNEAKTKTIGFLPKEKVQSLKGWDEYVDKSTKLSVLRTEAQGAKNSVREALKERLNEANDIDFVVEGDRIRVFRVFRTQQQTRRTRSLDLSSSFRDQPLKAAPSSNQPGSLLITGSRTMTLADAMQSGIQPARVNYGVVALHQSRFIPELGPSAPVPVPG